MVRLRLKPEEGSGTLFLKIDTSCHIEFLHLSNRMLCKAAAPDLDISSSLQHLTCSLCVCRLRHFNKMIVKMLTIVNKIVLPSTKRFF
jgi:hypothetical protein